MFFKRKKGLLKATQVFSFKLTPVNWKILVAGGVQHFIAEECNRNAVNFDFVEDKYESNRFKVILYTDSITIKNKIVTKLLEQYGEEGLKII